MRWWDELDVVEKGWRVNEDREEDHSWKLDLEKEDEEMTKWQHEDGEEEEDKRASRNELKISNFVLVTLSKAWVVKRCTPKDNTLKSSLIIKLTSLKTNIS